MKENLPNHHLAKLPPQDIDLEEVVLGAIMLEKNALSLVIDVLKPDVFYKDQHQKVFKAIYDLAQKSSPIDLLTVTDQLRKQNELDEVGGIDYLIGLTDRVASSANIEYHAQIIFHKYQQRELIRISQKTAQLAYEPSADVDELMEQLQADVFSMLGSTHKRKVDSMSELMMEFLKDLEKKPVNGLSGIGSGFKPIDRITGGWQKSDLIILAARPGMGKCHGRGTKVVMFDGTIKKVEDVVPGDQLMGVDSTPRNVLSIARGREQMYWIRQNRGIDYRVNESHILSLKASGTEYSRKHGEVVNISVKDYLAKSTKFKIRHKGYKASGVEFPEKILLLDPYFLGLWLGDGDSATVRISNPDIEIENYLKEFATKHGMAFNNRTYGEDCPTLCVVKKEGIRNKIKDLLDTIGVLNNKHIPDDYLYNSRENRLRLLAGLIDTDGYYQKQSNLFEIVQVNENLACQIKYLCHSLGFACSIKKKETGIASTSFSGTAYRIIISGNLHLIPTKVIRKQADIATPNKDWLVTGIKVEKDIVDDYYGFTLDGDHLYLLEDFTVTHNTAFTLSLAKNAAIRYNIPTLFFSLEMGSMQLLQRMASDETDIYYERIRKKDLAEWEWQQLHSKIGKLTEAPIFFDDTPSLSVFELRVKARRMKQQHKIELIIIDYLQLMEGKSGKNVSREQEIASISRGLKALAKELDVPIIALSQLSRSVESRAGNSKRPQLSDLRDSGSIEQDADMVGFLYRPEYYGIMEDEQGRSTAGICELIFAKNRAGVCETVALDFNGAYMRFRDLEQRMEDEAMKQVQPVEPIGWRGITSEPPF